MKLTTISPNAGEETVGPLVRPEPPIASRVFLYKNSLGPGVSSALSVINFGFCLVIIAIYIALVRPTKEQ